MPAKFVEFSPSAERQLDAIEAHSLQEADRQVAEEAIDAILDAAERLATLPVIYRPAARAGLREYVMVRFLFVLIYRVTARKIQIAAILHQRQNR